MATFGVAAIAASLRGPRATLTSLDDGTVFNFPIPPSEQEREYSATWEECGVAQASPQFLEARQANPEVRTITFTLSAYEKQGLGGSIEGQLATLKKLTRNAPEKKRPHRCLFTHGEQSYRCVVERVNPHIDRIGLTGGALRTIGCTITLKELPAR